MQALTSPRLASSVVGDVGIARGDLQPGDLATFIQWLSFHHSGSGRSTEVSVPDLPLVRLFLLELSTCRCLWALCRNSICRTRCLVGESVGSTSCATSLGPFFVVGCRDCLVFRISRCSDHGDESLVSCVLVVQSVMTSARILELRSWWVPNRRNRACSPVQWCMPHPARWTQWQITPWWPPLQGKALARFSGETTWRQPPCRDSSNGAFLCWLQLLGSRGALGPRLLRTLSGFDGQSGDGCPRDPSRTVCTGGRTGNRPRGAHRDQSVAELFLSVW